MQANSMKAVSVFAGAYGTTHYTALVEHMLGLQRFNFIDPIIAVQFTCLEAQSPMTLRSQRAESAQHALSTLNSYLATRPEWALWYMDPDSPGP